MHKHLKEQLLPPDHINTNLSAGVAEVIEVMMAKKRENRYNSTEDLLKDLQAVQRGEAPLQARRRVDPHVLRNLAKMEKDASKQVAEPDVDSINSETVLQVSAADQTRSIIIILMGVALVLETILLVFLFLRH